MQQGCYKHILALLIRNWGANRARWQCIVLIASQTFLVIQNKVIFLSGTSSDTLSALTDNIHFEAFLWL